MKKNILSLIALVVALCLVAFASSKRATLNFKYIGTSYTEAQVENIANWASGSLLCNNVNAKACNILSIPDSYYHFDGTTNVLNHPMWALANPPELGFTIVAATIDGINYHVAIVPAGTIRNKSL